MAINTARQHAFGIQRLYFLNVLKGTISVVCRAPFEINRNRIMPHSCTAHFQQLPMGFSQKHKELKDLFT